MDGPDGETETVEPLGPAYLEKATAALGVQSHATRLRAVLLMAVLGEVSVSTLWDTLGTRQTNLSHHLRILRDAGLVADRRDGQSILYHVDMSTW